MRLTTIVGAPVVLSPVGVAAYAEQYGNPAELGRGVYATAQSAGISETSSPARPGSAGPVQKVASVIGVGDQVCAVGYCKES